eukprot:TRINITY_DN1432_c0_g1_i1.p1 TRINITY_DN1432_c0_g1~~TRINITY_DN1432_c0_g1_i1.p1  ORF type:complete len:333 (+),score=195.04 TRINITY_DN1432_c0_g1_i1:67-1065(+)
MAKLFCMGNPLLDISANVDAAFLEKYGLAPASAILAEEKHMPIYGELEAKSDVVYIPGGATLNSARVANWVAGRSDKWVTYSGSIANDARGKILKEKSESEGLDMPMYIAEEATGTCAVCVVDKERSLVANLSAASKFQQAHVQSEAVKAAVEAASFYYISGFFLTTCAPAMQEVAEHANAQGKCFTMNLSAEFIVQFFGEPLMAAVELTDILFGNESEARALAKAKGWDTEEVKEIAALAQKLPKKGKARTVVFTQGSEKTWVATEGGVTGYDVTKVDTIVDTNGAGDAFVGGFLAQLAAGKDMETCVQTGHKSAGRIIQVAGCQFPEKFE